MKRAFAASVWQEGECYVAQALEVDVSSYGDSADEALDGLREALELYFEPPTPEFAPKICSVEVEVDAAQTAAMLLGGR